jgi:hypothetical protein
MGFLRFSGLNLAQFIPTNRRGRVGWATRLCRSINDTAPSIGALRTRPALRVGKIAQLRTIMIAVPGNFAHPTIN